jgi:hypothetical protein
MSARAIAEGGSRSAKASSSATPRIGKACPGLFEPQHIHAHGDDPDHTAVAFDRAREAEGISPAIAQGEGEGRLVLAQRLDEERRLAVVRPELVAVGRSNGAPVAVDEGDLGRTEFALKRDQPLGRGGVVGCPEGCDQGRIAREQHRHDRVALHLRDNIAGIEREAQFGPIARGLGETLGQKAVCHPDRPECGDHEHDREQPQPQTPERRAQPLPAVQKSLQRLQHARSLARTVGKGKEDRPFTPPRWRKATRQRARRRRCRPGLRRSRARGEA